MPLQMLAKHLDSLQLHRFSSVARFSEGQRRYEISFRTLDHELEAPRDDPIPTYHWRAMHAVRPFLAGIPNTALIPLRGLNHGRRRHPNPCRTRRIQQRLPNRLTAAVRSSGVPTLDFYGSTKSHTHERWLRDLSLSAKILDARQYT
jgi:hypothetical protein